MKFDFSFISRKKKYDSVNIHETDLSRVLGLVDITALGISCTLGNGIYVLAGDVIANYSGPSIAVSFIIAGLATFIAGICYAEFGARVPRSGSAYTYIYVTIGEFIAFILGWDLILEYVIGVSSGASALSRYIDALFDNKIQKILETNLPMNLEGVGPYPDFLAFTFVILITLFMVVGVKESSLLNKIFTGLNIIVIGFIVFSGVIKADLANWKIQAKPDLNWIDASNHTQSCANSTRCGDGGFFPFGFSGVIQGAAKCFYAYIGFDAIASTGEEVLNPKKNIPLSIIITLIVVSLCYCSVSFVLTLMIPYYMIDPNVPLPQAFDYVGLNWAKIFVSTGAIASLITCLYASMFPMPRVVYSLASDGLIFRCLSIIMPKLKTPVTAAIFSGLFAAILALIFDLNQLIDMMSIGTLMAYSVVALCIIILRYRPHNDEEILVNRENEKKISELKYNHLIFGKSEEKLLSRLFRPESKKCNNETSRLVNALTIIAGILIVIISILLSMIKDLTKSYIILIFIIFISCLLFLITFIISKQPQDENIKSFKVPFVPLFPFISVLINTYLMMSLSWHTWLRFCIWFFLGIFVYFAYGIRNSSLRNETKHKEKKECISFCS